MLQRRLRSIKDRFREMTLWFEQVMLEDGEQVGEEQVPENQQQEVEEQNLNIEPSDEHVQHLDNTAVTKVLLLNSIPRNVIKLFIEFGT